MNNKIRNQVLEKYKHSNKLHRKFTTFISNRKGFEIIENEVSKTGTILDLGCGHGYLCHYLSLTGKDRKIIGLDNDPVKIIEAGRSNDSNNVTFVLSDVTRNRLPDVDIVIVYCMLYQIPNHEKEDVIRKVYDCLNPNGMFIIREVENDDLLFTIKDYIRNLPVISLWRKMPTFKLYYPKKDYYKTILKDAGFNNIIKKDGCIIANKENGNEK